MTDLKGPEVGLRALFALVAACEGLTVIDTEYDYDDLQTHCQEVNEEIERIRALAEAVRLDILDKAPPGLD